jgi:uncharacterized protein with HEPN domain
MLDETDIIRLRHMLEAAEAAVKFIEGQKRNELDTNRMLSFALVRAIEIIGEAASKTTQTCREAFPDIPWASIVGMRNRIIHAYFDIDLNLVWYTVTYDLPPLITTLREILSAENQTP